MRPEEKAEIILWDWLKTKSKYVQEVYFNRKNLLNWKCFTTSGINKKPDFIIKIDRGFGIEYVAIEIKSSEQSKNIHDAGKIIDYYERFVFGETKYFIEGKEIQINHFIIASDNSLKGHLFWDEKTLVDNIKSKDDWRRTNAKFKLEPQQEYYLTASFVRGLWATFRRFRKDKLIPKGPSIGILIANFSEEDFGPHLMIMNYNSHTKKKSWGARFWKI